MNNNLIERLSHIYESHYIQILLNFYTEAYLNRLQLLNGNIDVLEKLTIFIFIFNKVTRKCQVLRLIPPLNTQLSLKGGKRGTECPNYRFPLPWYVELAIYENLVELC